MARKATLGALAAFCVLVVVLVVNTLLVRPRGAVTDRAPAVVAIDRDAAARRLGDAIRLRTVSQGREAPVAGEAFLELHRLLESRFPRAHAALARETVGDFSLLYTWRGTDPGLRPILLAAHLDVVPVEPGTEAVWEQPPFSGAVADGFVWGRGALDDKVSVVGTLEAVEVLLGQDFAPARTVYLAFGHDEEIDGLNGAKKIVQVLADRGVRLDFSLDEGGVIVHDLVPGVRKPVALIGIAEKGYLSLRLAVKLPPDQCGHSSMPPRTSAMARLAVAVQRLEANRMRERIEPPVTLFVDALAPEMSFPMRLVAANRWLFRPILKFIFTTGRATNALIRTTTAVTIVRGGVKANVIPCEAEAVVNFRILPGDTVETVTAHTRAMLDDPGVTVEQIEIANEPSAVSGVDTRGYEALKKTVRQVFPETVSAPFLVLAGTDSKHYAEVADNSYRFLPVRLGPADLARIHGADERISVENYEEVVRFYVQLMQNTLSPEAVGAR